MGRRIKSFLTPTASCRIGPFLSLNLCSVGCAFLDGFTKQDSGARLIIVMLELACLVVITSVSLPRKTVLETEFDKYTCL